MTEWENKIIAYVNSELSEIESIKLLNEIEKSKELKQLFSEYQNLENNIANTVEELPTNKLAHNFHNHLKELQNENENTKSTVKVFSINPLLKYAVASVAIFAVSITLWNQLVSKNPSEQLAINAILTDMKTESDTEKINTFYINNQPTKDNYSKIKQVLIASLKNDKSSNVRLASVETLMEYVDDDLVRSALIRSLGIEKDPQVQVAIIMALSESKNREVIKPLEDIINKEGGYKFVKDEAHIGLMNVTSI